MRHVHDPAPRPSHVVPELPPQVDSIILRALAKDPTRRWGSAGAFAHALRDWRNTGPPPPGARTPQVVAAPPPVRGSLAPTIVVVILVLAALAALLWTGFHNLPDPVEPTPSSVLIPPAPVITGGIDQDTTTSDELAPQIVPANQSLPDLEDIRSRPRVTMPVMMECGGNGRAHLSPRPVSAPWHDEAVGCAEWTGTPLRPILEEAGLIDDAVEVLFAGYDRGYDRDVEHDYERSLTVEAPCARRSVSPTR